jgi:hypothetical protein
MPTLHQELDQQLDPGIQLDVIPDDEWTMQVDPGYDDFNSNKDGLFDNEHVNNKGSHSLLQQRSLSPVDQIHAPFVDDPEVFLPAVPPLDPGPGLKLKEDEVPNIRFSCYEGGFTH